MENVTIFREPGRYGGWPANHGIWIWRDPSGNGKDEIVVGFQSAYMDLNAKGLHTFNRERGTTEMQARSRDGGRTWEATDAALVVPPKVLPAALDEPIDFSHPDLAIRCMHTGQDGDARSCFFVSYDRCATWSMPFALPLFGRSGIAARTDYEVYGPRDCLFFFTVTRTDRKTGQALCARTTDGGRTFGPPQWITPEPTGNGRSAMPAHVRFPDGRLLAAVRCRPQDPDGLHFIDLWASADDGRSWQYVTRPAITGRTNGNPPSMALLRDGRIALTYGYRAKPQGIRARISADEGRTWGSEIVLRDDGGNDDLGYTRTVQRSDGRMVTAYYFNDRPDGERYIAATIWDP